MADVAAASLAQTQPPPSSPQVKHEASPLPELLPDDLTEQPRPVSPLKRSRSHEDEAHNEISEKRIKIAAEDDDKDLDELAQMIKQAEEESLAAQLLPDPAVPVAPDIELPTIHDGLAEEISAAQLASDPAPIAKSSEPRTSRGKHSIWSDPKYHITNHFALPILGKSAVDLLDALSEQSLEDTIATLGEPDSDVAKAFNTLRAYFDHHRKLFSDSFPILYPDQLEITAIEDLEIIRIVNLATFCASMFGANELGFPDLNDNFLQTFVAKDNDMSQDVAELFIGLKTQMFITQLETEQELTKTQLLDDLFGAGLENSLKKHHPQIGLSTVESDFLRNATIRRELLLTESKDDESIHVLSQQYTYEAFLDSLSTYVNENMDSIDKLGNSRILQAAAESQQAKAFNGATLDDLGMLDLDAVIAEASKAARKAVDPNGITEGDLDIEALIADDISRAVQQAQQASAANELPPALASIHESASQATRAALQSIQQNQYHPTVPPSSAAQNNLSNGQNFYQPQQTQPPQAQHQYYQTQQQPQSNTQQSQPQTPGYNLPPNQSDTTSALYERARQAAAARTTSHTRREGTHSTRRPWSPEEEKALMMGLDTVKGPHWSQILSLYGPNGQISNILADRTQVQLKDKARNLKLFFLKTNSEMPYYLQCVTGELKTRAPTQAARKEAEERARLNSEEQQAHFNATMALAGGLQNPPKPAAGGQTPRTGTPGQAHHPMSHLASQAGVSSAAQIPSSSAQAQTAIPATQTAALGRPGPLGSQPPAGQQSQHHAQPQQAQYQQQAQLQRQSQPQQQPQPIPHTQVAQQAAQQAQHQTQQSVNTTLPATSQQSLQQDPQAFSKPEHPAAHMHPVQDIGSDADAVADIANAAAAAAAAAASVTVEVDNSGIQHELTNGMSTEESALLDLAAAISREVAAGQLH